MPEDFTGPFADRLNTHSAIEVSEAVQGTTLEPGTLHIAPGNHHLRVARNGTHLVTCIDDGPKVSGFRPSVDVLFESVASACGKNAIGLVMTGMGSDGAAGIRLLHDAGEKTLAKDQESSVVYGMPKAAFETGCVDQVVPLTAIPDTLAKLLAPVGAPA
jgi:two-component system chemotaxis response regulator CheB